MYLLDTNVISELRKARSGKADKQVVAWIKSVQASSLYLSVIVIQELEIGTLLAERRDTKKGTILRTWLEKHVLPVFANRILPINLDIARRSAKLYIPNPRPSRDVLIAATALEHHMTTVTRNVADYAPTGVPVINPWVVDKQ